MKLPYFLTWSKQTNTDFFTLHSAKNATLKTDLKTGDKGELIDLSSISYQANFGHTPKTVIKAVKSQLNSLVMAAPKSFFKLKHDTSLRLIKFLFSKDLGKIFYTTGGAESIDNALKMARDFSGKKLVVARQNSYHGATMGALSVTGDWRHNHHLTMGEYTLRIPEPQDDPKGTTLQQIVEENHGNIAAFCLETITVGNGVIIPPETWYQKIHELCQKYSILLILDEVACGFYRTGESFAFKSYPFLQPDFVCMSKAISAGVIPFGAVWVHDKIATSYDDKILSCGLTSYAHPMGLAALKGVLDICESQKFKKTLKANIRLFTDYLQKIKPLKKIKKIRHIGMLAALDLDMTVLASQQINFKNATSSGIFIAIQNGRIILAPPLTITKKELSRGMERLIKLLQKESL